MLGGFASRLSTNPGLNPHYRWRRPHQLHSLWSVRSYSELVSLGEVVSYLWLDIAVQINGEPTRK